MLYNDVFTQYMKSLGKYNQDSDDLAKDIIDHYNSYVKKITSSSKKHLYNGLVVGYVQSGKTMNFCHVMNRAIDVGFQLIVVLSSNKKDLNEQTADRLADDIVGYVNPNVPEIISLQGHPKGHDFMTFENGKTDTGVRLSGVVNQIIAGNQPFSGINIASRNPDIYWLTACDKGASKRNVDFAINKGDGQESFDDYYNYDKKGCYLAVVKKNPTRLELLYKFLKNSSIIRDHKIKVLFIDDECDEITVSGTGGRAAGNGNIGKSSKMIRKIQNLLETDATDPEHNMYIEYTATPIANICAKNRSNATKTGFPDDFIEIMKQADGYCGFRAYQNYSSILRKEDAAQQGEMDFLQNCSPSSFDQWSYVDFKAQTPILYEAVIQFLWNCQIFAERHRNGNVSDDTNSMLIHTDLKIETHALEKTYVEKLLETISDELFQELDNIYTTLGGNYVFGTGTSPLIDDFSACYQDIQAKMGSCNVSQKNGKSFYQEPEFTGCNIGHYPGNVPFALSDLNGILSMVIKRIPNQIYHTNIHININSKRIKVYEVNSQSGAPLPVDENFIAVGGNRLSRGLTLKNLSVTYFSRSTGALDTLTQMARWFGYRNGYLDICRLYTDDYTPISAAAEVEQNLHNQISIQKRKGLRPANMHLYFAKNVPQVLSGKQVLYKVNCKAGEMFESLKFYNTRGTNRNKELLDKFFDILLKQGYSPAASGHYGVLNVVPQQKQNPGRYCYVQDIPAKLVKQLFEHMRVPSNSKIIDELMLAKEFLTFNPYPKVNLLVSGRNANAANASTSFGSQSPSLFHVVGKAGKSKIKNVTASIFEVDPFEDCPEDYVVDYDVSQGTLDQDFNTFVGGRVFQTSRDSAYRSAVRKFGETNRTKPLVIITPFEIPSSSQLAGTTYYSVKILCPQNAQACDILVI